MKLDLHVHTRNSGDCSSEIREVVATAEEIGLDAIAITDHNTLAAVERAIGFARKIKIIPAMEITARDGTHLIGLFLEREIARAGIMDIIDEVHRQNGLVMIPHPFRPGTGLFYNRDRNNLYDGDAMSSIMAGIDLVEAVNYRCDVSALIDTDRYLEFHRDMPRVAGSDAHRLDEIGKAFIELDEIGLEDLGEIKTALLESNRLLHYEVYTEPVTVPEMAASMKVDRRSLIIKAKNLVQKTIITPVQSVYRNSIYRITGERRPEIEGQDRATPGKILKRKPDK